MPVGRPIKLTPNVARRQVAVTATAGQTSFTPSGVPMKFTCTSASTV